MTDQMAEDRDRSDLEELETMIRRVRDRAHWLNVHRRMRLAGHIEAGADVLLRLCYDLRGRHARKEPL